MGILNCGKSPSGAGRVVGRRLELVNYANPTESNRQVLTPDAELRQIFYNPLYPATVTAIQDVSQSYSNT